MSQLGVGTMSKLELVLVPGATELPDCPCGAEMRLDRTETTDQSRDTEVRIFVCAACGHELRLMVWADVVRQTGPVVGL
jgi:hypothetical protein